MEFEFVSVLPPVASQGNCRVQKAQKNWKTFGVCKEAESKASWEHLVICMNIYYHSFWSLFSPCFCQSSTGALTVSQLQITGLYLCESSKRLAFL